MKITFINHSDRLGGASVVCMRLIRALRAMGHDARMLVMHKEGDDSFVLQAAGKLRCKEAFLSEHLKIFTHNGFNRRDLFKVSIASNGIGIPGHPWVKNADVVVLNWVNQGMMSLDDVRKIGQKKPLLWIMHDMWNLTGICHHAGSCGQYTLPAGCSHCPLLHSAAGPNDLSQRVWQGKDKLYQNTDIRFIAVSNWLAQCCKRSSLMANQKVVVLPNAFPVEEFYIEPTMTRRELLLPRDNRKIILMGAARLDDPIKGLDKAIEILNKIEGDNFITIFFGACRNPQIFDNLKTPYKWIGPVSNPIKIHELYAHASVVISTSLFETLPGTLIEGQAAGCTPIAFDSGGQSDIITDGVTGHLIAPYDTDAFAAAIGRALQSPLNPNLLKESVEQKFAARNIAKKFIDIING